MIGAEMITSGEVTDGLFRNGLTVNTRVVAGATAGLTRARLPGPWIRIGAGCGYNVADWPPIVVSLTLSNVVPAARTTSADSPVPPLKANELTSSFRNCATYVTALPEAAVVVIGWTSPSDVSNATR